MMSDALLQLAKQTTEHIHDEVLLVRALLELAQIERACSADPESTLASAGQLVEKLGDAEMRVILACDLAQTSARLRRDPYRFLEFAKSETLGVSIRAEIYIALVEAKLGNQVDCRLRWAEKCAGIQRPTAWLVQTQAAVARIQAEAGDWSGARCTIRRIDDGLQRFVSWCELALSAYEQGNDWALDALPQVDHIARLTDGVRAKCILTITAHSLGLDPSDHLDQLFKMAGRLWDSEDQHLTGVLIARVLARCQELGIARQIVGALPEPAQQEALLGLCQETAQAGNVEETQTLAGELMVPGYRDRALYYIVCSVAGVMSHTTRETRESSDGFQS